MNQQRPQLLKSGSYDTRNDAAWDASLDDYKSKDNSGSE